MRRRVLAGNVLGIVFMVASGVLLTSSDAIVKLLVAHYGVGQILFIHASWVIVLLLVFGATRGELGRLAVVSWRAQLLRGACYVAGTFAFVTALRYLPLVDAVAISFASPIMVAALAPFWLGETVKSGRWAAVVVGFVGVLIMLRPNPDMHWALLLPLIVATADAFRDLITRQMTSNESTFSILLVTTAMVAAAATPFAAVDWKPITPGHFGLFAAAACVFAGAHYCIIEAFRNAEASVVVPFRYLHLIWSTLAGFMLWHHLPDRWLIVGAAFTVLSGLYVLREETKRPAG